MHSFGLSARAGLTTQPPFCVSGRTTSARRGLRSLESSELMCSEERLMIEFESLCKKVRDPMVGEMVQRCDHVSRRLQGLHEERLFPDGSLQQG